MLAHATTSVVACVTVTSQDKSGEEHRADDEHGAGDDRNPCCGLIEPVGTATVRLLGRVRVGSGR